MKLQFIPIWEYDPSTDKARVLGYPKDDSPMIPSLVQVYQRSEEGWAKLRGRQWRKCDPPFLFCDVPDVVRLKYRKPTKEKIESLDMITAMQYAKKDKRLQSEILQITKDYLTKEFY